MGQGTGGGGLIIYERRLCFKVRTDVTEENWSPSHVGFTFTVVTHGCGGAKLITAGV